MSEWKPPERLEIPLTVNDMDGNEREVHRIAYTLEADSNTRWHELFGTPERAAKTAWRLLMCRITTKCDECPMEEGCDISTSVDCDDGEAALLEWLEGADE